jgi:hypothetical protein
MKKRDVTIYDETLSSISEQLTEYDVDIVTLTIAPNELNRLVNLEKDFGQKYPKLKFNYSLIEADPQTSNKFSNPKAKLIYTSET